MDHGWLLLRAGHPWRLRLVLRLTVVPSVRGDSAFPVHLPLSSSDTKTLPRVSCVSWQERDTGSSPSGSLPRSWGWHFRSSSRSWASGKQRTPSTPMSVTGVCLELVHSLCHHTHPAKQYFFLHPKRCHPVSVLLRTPLQSAIIVSVSVGFACF